MRYQLSLALSVALCLSSGTVRAQPSGQTATTAAAQRAASEAARRLRTLYFQQDFEGGHREGEALVRQFPNAPEVRAWHIVNMARYGLADQAIAAADSLARRSPGSPWGPFARAFALSWEGERAKDAIPLARRALAARPRDTDFVWLYGFVLHRNSKYEEVVAFVDSVRPRVEPWAELLVLKGNALGSLSSRPKADSTLRGRAAEAFAEARRMDSTNVNAYFIAGANLGEGPTDTAAHALLERAAQLSPYSSNIHENYWDATQSLRTLSAEEKRARIEHDIGAILRARGDYPGALLLAATGYRTLKDTVRLHDMQERILREHPASGAAERVVYERIRALRDSLGKNEVADSALARSEYRRQLRTFLERPVHVSRSRLGDAYLALFQDINDDSTIAGAELLRVVKGMVQYNTLNPQITHVEAPIVLAERKLDFALAERLAREGDARWKKQFEGMEAYLSVGELADRLDMVKGMQRDALGWVYFNQGKLGDAERELNRARELAKSYSLVYYHLGRLAEARGQLNEAEGMYGKGFQFESVGWTAKKNGDALKRLFTARRGSLEGFDAYVEELKEQDRARRRAKIAESRIADPEPVPSFTLPLLGGGHFSSDSLKGKVAVINFWGVWCGPCIKEAPDIQRFHEKFRGDTSVVFITIDNDEDPETVREFMAKKKYDFPVLLDSGYVKRAGVSAWPTTWFLDRDGRMAFTHSGASDVVFEEFVWRVEMLTADRRE